MQQTLIQPTLKVIMSYSGFSNCLKFSLLFFFLLLLQFSHAQNNWQALDKILNEKQKALGEDLVVLIVTRDSINYIKQTPTFTTRTAAPVASSSKWLSAAFILQLVDEGKISLDDRVAKYLPEFEKYGKGYITIRNCLSHTTGIQHETPRLTKILDKKKFQSLEEEVKYFASREIQNNPGEAFRYNGMGLNIAARVVEVVTKKKFDMLIRQKLFVPLGMRNTTFSTLDGSAPNPSGGAKSTAADYIKFLQMILNNGQFNGQTILSENSIKELTKVHTTADIMRYVPKSGEGYLYALGSWVVEAEGDHATALASPGLFGTWPMVDFKKGYAVLFFNRTILGEQKAGAYMEVKKIIDKIL
jgi:CubicO group peptidase (beta-lactamase class C family)